MACSLESRAPFLDHELVEFVMGLPFGMEVKRVYFEIHSEKSSEKVAPDEIIKRPKKGFGVPIENG